MVRMAGTGGAGARMAPARKRKTQRMISGKRVAENRLAVIPVYAGQKRLRVERPKGGPQGERQRVIQRMALDPGLSRGDDFLRICQGTTVFRLRGCLSGMRFKLILEFDGTRYSGWQQQADAKSVQGALLAAASTVLPGQSLDLQGCGRTDAGVHGLRYPAHLEATTDLTPGALAERLNDLLPADINVLAAEPVHPRFHARHTCLGRSYLYQIALRRTAFCRRYVYWRREPLAASRMAAAAGLLAGMHDFAAFTDRRALKKKSAKVFVNKAEIAAAGDDLIRFRIVGSHFLWKMIRNIVGVLIEIGAGRMDLRDLEGLLAGQGKLPAGLLAPPSGLFLEAAFYDEESFEEFLASEPLRPLFF